jgi:hypothetical protein
MTNSIRPVVVASLLGKGEAQDAVAPAHRVNKAGDGQLWGEKQIDPGDGNGWLETEWWDGSVREAGRPAGSRASERTAGGSQRNRSSGEAE